MKERTQAPPPSDSRVKLIREWLTLAAGLTGAALGIASFVSVKNEQHFARKIQAGEHLAKVASLMETSRGALLDGEKEISADVQDSIYKEISAALDLDPDDPYAHMRKVDFLEITGLHDEAINYCKKMTDRYPTYGGLYLTLGVLYQKDNKLDEALHYYNLAINSSGGDKLTTATAKNNIGTIHDKMGNPESARSDYEAAVRASPNNPTANFNLGVLLCKSGDLAKARSYLSKAEELIPVDCAIAETGGAKGKVIIAAKARSGGGSIDPVVNKDFSDRVFSPKNGALWSLDDPFFQGPGSLP